MQTTTLFLVGYYQDLEFWCHFETTVLDEAKKELSLQRKNRKSKEWYIYQKSINFDKLLF
jgi:hypothetical protein